MKKFVYYIDDYGAVRRGMERFLGRWENRPPNVEIRIMDSTQGLLDAAWASEGDVLLFTDGCMRQEPGFDCDGDVLIERLRELIGKRLIRAVIVTSAPSAFASASRRLGAEIVEKAVRPTRLREIIKDFAAD